MNNSRIKITQNALGLPAVALLLSLFFSPGGGARRAPDDIREIVRKTKAAYNTTQSAEVKFEQTSGSGSPTNGTLTYAEGDKYRLELGKQTIISDGQKTWTYTPAKKQVVISKAATGASRLTPGQILTAFPGDYATSLTGSATVNGRAVWIVRCIPGSGKKIGDVTAATLYIDKSTYRFQQVDVESPTIGKIKLRITSATYGAKVPASRFSFTPPSGVRVIDLSR